MSGRAGVWLLVAGAVAVAASPFLPWVTASVAAGPEQAGEAPVEVEQERGQPAGDGDLEAAQTGWESPLNAWVVVGAGVAGLAAAGLAFGGRAAAGARLGTVAGVVAAVMGWRGYRYARDPDTLLFLRDDSLVMYRVGVGLWLLVAGALLVLVAGAIVGRGARAQPEAAR